MHTVALFYWAGAKAAAGTGSETVEAATVAEALRMAVQARPDGSFALVIPACSVLIDSLAAAPSDLDRVLTGPVRVDVLPPFAGGAGVEIDPVVWTKCGRDHDVRSCPARAGSP